MSFALDYPVQSQFVAIMNDASGIGAGGTSSVMTVEASPDTSCLNAQQVSPKFDFFQSPTNITQCGVVNFSWQSAASGPVDILALVPDGNSFMVANITNGSRSVEWRADIRAGTEMFFVAGDESGLGTGGSTDIMAIEAGDSTCLSSTSPSSTGVLTSGSTPTPTTGSVSIMGSSSGATPTAASSHNSKHDIGLIIGLALGIAAAFVCAVALYLLARCRRGRPEAYRDIDSGTARPRPLNVPRRALLNLQRQFWRSPGDDLRREMYQADPFIVPVSTSSFGTIASSGVLDPPPRAHSVYRHSEQDAERMGADYAAGDQSLIASRGARFRPRDCAHAPSDASSATLADLDDEHAFGGRRGLRANPAGTKLAQGQAPNGLRLVSQEPGVDHEMENASWENEIFAIARSGTEGPRDDGVGLIASHADVSISDSSPTRIDY